jgi:hypothetical protein
MAVKNELTEEQMKAVEMRFPRYVAGCTLWDKEIGDEIKSQIRMRKLDKQIHEKKEK